LAKDWKRNKVHQNEKGKNATLKYERLNYHDGSKSSLLSVELITGRSHQIRAQFGQRNHPLLGDRKYGAKKNDDVKGIALWAYSIRFKHPTTKEEMVFTSPPDVNAKPWVWFRHLFA
jgi:23S rRNA pseudouridine1911/1915/1917 synthase